MPPWTGDVKGGRPAIVIMQGALGYLPLGAAPLPVAPFPMLLPAGAPGVLTRGPPLVPGAIPEPVEPVRSAAFSELLFTLPGLFILPSVRPPPAGVCARTDPERASENSVARLSVRVNMGISPGYKAF
ncbi:hypothetical protein ME121_0193 [Methylobacterium sp. ME121]|nr:hypothetical protein ME121_0193 [Methylobacterium sp. ME121]